MSRFRNWDSHNPSLASECAPLPRSGGRGAHSPAGEGLGEFQFRRLEKKLSTLPTLCVASLKVHKIENFFGSDFEFCVISLLVLLKY
jgi:hypothetical protein